MNRSSCIKTAVLIIAAVTVFGCKSKQDAPGADSPAAPASVEGIKSISGQSATGAPAASPKDKADAEAAAAHVLAQMEAGDFSAIYKEAAPGFKQIGKEADFVAAFQRTRQKTGALKDARQASFTARPDQALVLVYSLENDKFKSDRRLTFTRSKAGKMELAGLNQHDEPKQSAAKK